MTCQKKIEHQNERNGFTLLELVVVIGTIGLLATFLLPVLAGTKRQDKSAMCMNNLRQIGVAMMVYATDNNDMFYCSASGSVGNAGRWTANPSSTIILDPTNGDAYWGVAYYKYVGLPREVFRCPSANIVDEWRETGLYYPSEFWQTSTYGMSLYLTQRGNSQAKITSFEYPSTMIMTQDSAEQRPEGATDSLSNFTDSNGPILAEWIGSGAPTTYGGLSGQLYGGYHFENEWYRHDKRCNTLWLSGNVSKIPFTGYNVGIDFRYYTGEKPARLIPGN